MMEDGWAINVKLYGMMENERMGGWCDSAQDQYLEGVLEPLRVMGT